ncbi:hypothetical protein CPB84DRAFT_1962785 [Gymnopilus junonius]|uniref:DUF6699 domain-containing protein n=1 Tax=Gymnopilus junonius TaxID=109634 RepID=A0A9P5NJI0_GYMJU|nr:hypothetical protein CPB84DRAFT_1962785 [Gymnopilus junonius]
MGERIYVNKWAPGTSYGPVLSQTDVYLLDTPLELNPILEGKSEHQPLSFHLVTGFTQTGMRGGDNSVYGKDEPATLPRVNQLIIISHFAPWCTIVKRDAGVTIGDVCSTIFKEYTEHEVTEAEFGLLNSRLQDQMKRTAAANFQQTQPSNTWGGGGYYAPAQLPDRIRRIDWLRDKVYFEGLARDDKYAQHRLGFKAPNVFVMELTG